MPFFRGRTFILAIPPWDFRMLWYGTLAKRNRLIYHTSWPRWEIGSVPRRYGLFSHLLKGYWHRVLSSSSVQIVVVASEAAKVVSQQFPKTHVSVIPHVVSSDFDEVTLNRPKGAFGVLFVGELIEKKGVSLLPTLIERLADLSTVHFGIVGAGALEPLVNSLEQQDTVSVYGKVSSRRDLAKIYAQHQVLIVPSQRTSRWEELFGMVIVEAMAVGLPVIASDHVGPRSIITHGEDGFLVSEASVDEFAHSIRHLCEQLADWERMSSNAKANAVRYSLESVSLQWIELLSSQDSFAANV
ncbi:MAG: glycosyltransferase [Phormidesmis sp.]